MNKWYKFLLTEADHPMIKNIGTGAAYADFELEVEELWNLNEFFRNSVIRIIMEHVLIPSLKRLPKHVFMFIKEAVLDSSSRTADKSDTITQMIQNAGYNHPKTDVIQYFDVIPVVMLLDLLFFPKDPVYRKRVSNPNFLHWLMDPLWYLFSDYPELIPVKPKLNRGLSKTKEENIKLINNHFRNHNVEIDETQMQDNNILDEIKLTEYLGGGVYGRVFKTSDGRALKVFYDSVSLKKDTDRMDKVMDDVYAGSASLADMHYFEKGELKARTGQTQWSSAHTTILYYALMPLVVPIDKAPFFDTSPVFNEAINAGYDTASHFSYRGGKPSFTDFKDYAISNLKNYLPADKLDDVEDYKDTINAIIYAAYRASTEYKGTDLHSGNIGYLAQKPDMFFFYDM